MKKRIVFLLVFTTVCSLMLGFSGTKNPTNAAPYFQKMDIVNATVAVDYLNVRQGISTNHPIVCVLKKGQTVKVLGKIADWYTVYEQQQGCVGVVKGDYLKIQWSSTAPKKTTSKAPVYSPKPAQTPMTSVTSKPSIVPSPGVVSPKPSAVASPTGVSADEQAVLDLVNKARNDAGLSPLSFDMQLQKVARLKAQDMVDKSYFSHDSPTYGSPFDMMRQFGVSFKYAGENIAGNSTVEGAFKAWMNSSGHKANILGGNFNYTGIGIVSSPTYGKVFVQQFIGR